MSALVELEQAARLHRAEARWLDQCADRLRRRAASPRPVSTKSAGPVLPSVEPAEISKETLR